MIFILLLLHSTTLKTYFQVNCAQKSSKPVLIYGVGSSMTSGSWSTPTPASSTFWRPGSTACSKTGWDQKNIQGIWNKWYSAHHSTTRWRCQPSFERKNGCSQIKTWECRQISWYTPTKKEEWLQWVQASRRIARPKQNKKLLPLSTKHFKYAKIKFTNNINFSSRQRSL